MNNSAFIFLNWCIVLTHSIDFISCITNNSWPQKLRFDLLNAYDVLAEPIPQNATVLKVNVGLTVLGVHVDYTKSTFYINGWIGMKWHDSRLKWNRTDYDDLTTIQLADHEIWKPQIIAMNKATAPQARQPWSKNAIVDENGLVLLVPVSNYKIYCNLNYRDWPFDEQVCELILRMSGTYKTPLRFNDTYNVDWYGTFSNWKIVNVNSQHVVKSCQICRGSISEMYYEFRIQKIEPVYYGFVVLPALGLCLLLLSLFWLPLTVMKKFSLNAVLIAVCCIFLVFLSRKVPILNHQLPKIIGFYSWLCTMTVAYLVVSMILFNMVTSQDLNDKPLSQRIKNLFDHPILLYLQIIPQRDSVVYQMNKIFPNEYHRSTDSSCSRYQWFLLAITINRLIFGLYAITAFVLMFYNFL